MLASILQFICKSLLVCKQQNFRVKAPVTRRPPHRSGREGLPQRTSRAAISMLIVSIAQHIKEKFPCKQHWRDG